MCVCVCFFLRIIKNSKKNVNVTIRGKLYDVGFGSDFFDMTPRAQATEEENSIISKLKSMQKAKSIE